MDSHILMRGMDATILKGVSETVCAAGIYKMKAATGIAE